MWWGCGLHDHDELRVGQGLTAEAHPWGEGAKGVPELHALVSLAIKAGE